MNTMSPEDICSELERIFPGMEYYFCSEKYSTEVCYRIGDEYFPNPHSEHGGFHYCGFVDCLSLPMSGRIFKSVTLNGLLRLIGSENPEHIPDLDKIPLIKRRFEL